MKSTGRQSGLRLHLFGPMQVFIDGVEIDAPRTRKSLWLLALLALRGGTGLHREWLVAQLWPDSDDKVGLANLRQCLFQLRKVLRNEACRIASEDGGKISFDIADVYIDTRELDELISRGDEDSLREALLLYTGSLVEDCAEPWVVSERTRLEAAHLRTIERLAEFAGEKNDHASAIELLRKGAHVDPYNEKIQKQLIEQLRASGDDAGAVFAYRQFRSLLKKDLGIAPSQQTSGLYADIRNGTQTSVSGQVDNRHRKLKCNVPAPLTDIVGREQELLEVRSALSTSRLVTLVGPGGVGKTRLAIETATSLAADFRDGSHFVDLSAVTDDRAAPEAIHASFGAPTDATKTAASATRQLLENANLLLVLDNCEHVVQQCGELVTDLLRTCPSLCILTTSRQPLGVPGEALWKVRGLSTSAGALQLFLARATAADATFKPTEANVNLILDVCRELDGLPLAIELAAARVASVEIAEIASRVRSDSAILKRTAATTKRHEGLDKAISWSWDLLSDEERCLLQRLSVFSRSWTLEAAEEICSHGIVSREMVLDLHSLLVGKSLVEYLPADDEYAARYRLLNTIQQFLIERFDADECREMRSRHLAYFAQWAESVKPKLWEEDQSYWFGRIDKEHDNVIAAIGWAREQSELVTEMKLVIAMSRFWDTWGHFHEGRSQLELAASRLNSEVPDEISANVLTCAGWIASGNNGWQTANEHYKRAVALYDSANMRKEADQVRGYLAYAVYQTGDLEGAWNLFEQSIATLREVSDRKLSAALNNYAYCLTDAGEFRQAEIALNECIDLCRGDPARRQLLGVALSNRAVVLKVLGQTQEAIALCREALCLFKSVNSRFEIPEVLDLFGMLEAIERRWQRAVMYFGMASQQRAETGIPNKLGDRKVKETESALERCKSELSAKEFEEAWSSGEKMSLDRAIEFAAEASALPN